MSVAQARVAVGYIVSLFVSVGTEAHLAVETYLQLVLACLSLRRGVEKIDGENLNTATSVIVSDSK